jgi:hypothetical protein
VFCFQPLSFPFVRTAMACSHLLLCLSMRVPIVLSLCSYGNGLQCCAASSQSIGEVAPCAGCGLLRHGVSDPAVFRCLGRCGVPAHHEGRSSRQGGARSRMLEICRAPKKSGIRQSTLPLQVGLAPARVCRFQSKSAVPNQGLISETTIWNTF